MDKWSKIKILSVSFYSIVIPVLLGFIGHSYTESIKEREIQGKFIELGVRILGQVPTEYNQNLRGWAVRVINKYSDVPIDEATKNELIKNTPIFFHSSSAYIVHLYPGQEFSFRSNIFRLESCNKKGRNSTACKFTIATNKDVIKLEMLVVYMDMSTYTFQFKGEGQEWSFNHGPSRRQEIKIKLDTLNHFNLLFSRQENYAGSHEIRIVILVNGERIQVTIHAEI